MTKTEETAKIGRLAVDYSEAKKHCALLESELSRAADMLDDLAPYLRRGDIKKSLPLLGSLDFSALMKNVQELEGARLRRDELGKTLTACGIDLNH
jgi:hypothetical protein